MIRLHPQYNLFSREYWFGQVDTRPLSVFRIALGLILLKDALFHLPLAYWLYSDQGIAPRQTISEIVREYRFSAMDALPFTWMAQAFFILWAVVLICYTVGWRTRLMTVLNFLFVVSVHERNIYVLNGADTVIRVMCFWTMFLPLGDYYSLDAMRARFARYLRSRDLADLRSSDEPHTTYAFPLRIAQIQFALIYVFTSILKIPGFAWQDGTAIFYALQLKSLTLPTGDFLVSTAPLWMLRIMSYQSFITEIVFFWFVFSPIGQPYLRMVALILGTMLHAGIGATMAIGNFSAVMISSYLIFFEPEWITWFGEKVRGVLTPSRLPVPAGPSPLWMLLAATTPREIQIEPDHMIAPGDHDDWWIVDSATERLTGAAAWQRAMGHLPLSKLYAWTTRLPFIRAAIWRVLCLISLRDVPPRPVRLSDEADTPEPTPTPLLSRIPRTVIGVIFAALTTSIAFWAISDSRNNWSITDWGRETVWAIIFMLILATFAGIGAAAAFDWLGNLRPMGDRAARLIRATGRAVLTSALVSLFCTILWWNFTTLRCARLESADFIGYLSRFWCENDRLIDSVPEVPRRMAQQLSLWQAWDMFSPYPSTLDGWIVIPGKFEDGTSYDLNTGKPVSTEFRRWFYGPGMRWKKYESNLSRDAPDDLLAAWGSYLCGYYNVELDRPRGQRLATLEIRFYQYRSHAPAELPHPMEDVMLWKHAVVAVAVLVALAGSTLPRAAEIGLGARVVAVSALLAVAIAAVLTLATSAGLRHRATIEVLRAGGRGQSASRGALRARKLLLVGQTALTTVLLVGAALLGRSFIGLLSIDPGYRDEGAVRVQLTQPSASDRDTAFANARRYEEIIARIAALAGVSAVGGANRLPLTGGSNGGFWDDSVTSFETEPPEPLGYADFRVASSGYFEAIGIPLRRGRLFEAQDRAGSTQVAVISEAVARASWGDRDPIGQRIQVGNLDSDMEPVTIVGVVGDVHERRLERAPLGSVYVSLAQRPKSAAEFNLVVRGSLPLAALMPALRGELERSVAQIPYSLHPLAELRADALAQRRFNLVLLGVFAAAALVLATSGLYGLMAFSVGQRRSELAVRQALGAAPARIRRHVLGDGGRIAAFGIGAGLVVALAASRLVASLLYGVSPWDPLALGGVAVLLGAALLAASALPALRAARIMPMEALRDD